MQIWEARWSSKANALWKLMGELPLTATSQVPEYSGNQCYTTLVSTLADIARSDWYDAAFIHTQGKWRVTRESVELEYLNKKHWIKKKFHDEKAEDEAPADPETRFTDTVLRPTLDQMYSSIRSRYAEQGQSVGVNQNIFIFSVC